ncbi:Protein of unknown function [Pyronema omphalodes CBS 100304]|uniref:Uncharacterized protein n=1 Tax=Pyronema omphalodes (strain CBS 100304) TaxID=1076935 RepID=U4KW13_PYROM|nr:Protein of unknown function [Pyronema omphalodes CBS 100304]
MSDDEARNMIRFPPKPSVVRKAVLPKPSAVRKAVSKVADLKQALKPEKQRTKTPEECQLELDQKEHEKAIKKMRRKHEKELKKARKKGQPRRSIIKVIPN